MPVSNTAILLVTGCLHQFHKTRNRNKKKVEGYLKLSLMIEYVTAYRKAKRIHKLRTNKRV